MSDLDDSTLDGGVDTDGFHSDDAHEGIDHDAMASINDDGEEEGGEMDQQDDLPADHTGAGFSSDDDGGIGGGMAADDGGDYNADDLSGGLDGGLGEEGDPSSIQAPAGSGSAATDAADRLARLMSQGGIDDDDDDMDLEERERHRREMAQLESQLADAHTSAPSSKRASQRRASQRSASFEEEKEASAAASAAASANASATASARSQREAASQRVSYRSGGVVDDLQDEFDEFDDLGSEYASDLSGDSDSGDGGGGVESEDEERTAEDVARAKEEREHLIEVNKIRQRQIALILEREKSAHDGKSAAGRASHAADEKSAGGFDPSANGGTHPEQIRSEYIKNLESLNVLWDTLESKREDAEDRIDRLTSKLDAYDERATELSDSFKSFKREIAKEAKFSRTGKPIKLKRILAFESAEEAKDRDVARVRLRHINLLNELRTLEDAVRVKEKLAEGLHLIDFEQLKIENQTLNEKIEERNDELHKLKKKTTTTVQVLTHIKEKLQCVREENMHSQSELRAINAAVQSLRDTLTRTKHTRDESRAENQSLKQKQGFIGSDLLVSDFENRKGDIDALRAQVDQLKAKWRALNALSLKATGVERANARMENQATMQRQSHYATVKFGSTAAAAAAARR